MNFYTHGRQSCVYFFFSSSFFFFLNQFCFFINLQFRERFKRKLNGIFPAVIDANPTRKTSKVNPSDVGVVGIIEVRPCSDVFELKEL